jgi:hypothetical protein
VPSRVFLITTTATATDSFFDLGAHLEGPSGVRIILDHARAVTSALALLYFFVVVPDGTGTWHPARSENEKRPTHAQNEKHETNIIEETTTTRSVEIL